MRELKGAVGGKKPNKTNVTYSPGVLSLKAGRLPGRKWNPEGRKRGFTVQSRYPTYRSTDIPV